MAEVELVIKISEEKYNTIKSKMYCGIYDAEVYEAISNGTILPKEHGRLIDADALLKKHPEFDTYPFPSTTIDNAPSIIEADGGRC